MWFKEDLLLREREFSPKARQCVSIMKILKKAKILKTVVKMGDYFHSVVSSINEHGCPDYQKVHVRDTCFDLSRAFINSFLERLADKSSWKALCWKSVMDTHKK